MARKDEGIDALPWFEAIPLLSLDLTAVFSRQLQLDHFYSDRLRSIARAAVPPFDDVRSVAWFVELKHRHREFVSAVNDGLGEYVLADLVEWTTLVYSPRAATDIPDNLHSHMCDLAYGWDTDTRIELPLRAASNAQARLLIRDYVACGKNVDDEIELTHARLASQWDDAIDRRFENAVTPHAVVSVMTIYGKLHDIDLWSRIKKELSEQDTSLLLQWMRERPTD